MKVTPIYKSSIVLIPFEIVSQKLSTATADELKVLLAVIAEQTFDITEMSGKLDMTVNAFRRSLTKWQDCGVIMIDDGTKKSRKKIEKTKPDANVEDSEIKALKPHIEGPVTLPHYTSEEIAGIVEKTSGCSELLDSCQQVLGKMFNAAETSVIIGLVDHLSLSKDYILLLCSHAAKMQKKSVRYVEKMALNYYDSDIMQYTDLEAELNMIEERSSYEYFVRNLFGLGKRALIKKEKEFISAWCDKYKFPRDVIERAYEITVSNTNEPRMNYTNAILENWYSSGYRNLEDVEKAIQEKSKKSGKADMSSFVTDDFYEAALKRSYKKDK